MKRYSISAIFLFCIASSVQTLSAASVTWKSSTNGARWVDQTPLQTSAWDNDNSSYIGVDEKSLAQEIDGWGGCFNEKGWQAILTLPKQAQDSIMRAMFDTATGLKFNICRTPIGCSDYSLSLYTLDDSVTGDYTMSKFSIARDKQLLIPYIKAAQAIRPDLKFWGSPWTAPPWMKTTNSYLGGTLKLDAQTQSAYALYFEKFVQAYLGEGIRIYGIHHQNEPVHNNNGWLITHWEPNDYRDFVKLYLGPAFKRDSLPVENWCGTMVLDDQNIPKAVFGDTIANAFCTGMAVQYSPTLPPWLRSQYPAKRLMLSETPIPGGNKNDWSDAEYNWNQMRTYLGGGVNSYMQWNMVLDQGGVACYGGSIQNAVIVANTSQKIAILTPQYFQVKHFTYYVKPGAYRIASTGNYAEALAFRNPDGQNVVVVANITGSSVTVAINLNGQKIKPALPAHSFNTFCVDGTPIPTISPVSQIEAENYTSESGTYTVPCSEGGSCVSYIHNNDWTVYDNLDFADGAKGFQARVAGAAGGTIEVRLDSIVAAPVATCTVAPTGTATTWKTVSCALTATIRGKHTLYLKFKGDPGTAKLFDLNWWKFEPGTAVVAGAGMAEEAGDAVKILAGFGKARMLRLDFSKNVARGNLKVCLFDLNGRVTATLFKGRLSSSSLTLPLMRHDRGPRAFVLKISLDDTDVRTKTIVMQ